MERERYVVSLSHQKISHTKEIGRNPVFYSFNWTKKKLAIDKIERILKVYVGLLKVPNKIKNKKSKKKN